MDELKEKIISIFCAACPLNKGKQPPLKCALVKLPQEDRITKCPALARRVNRVLQEVRAYFQKEIEGLPVIEAEELIKQYDAGWLPCDKDDLDADELKLLRSKAIASAQLSDSKRRMNKLWE